MPLRFCSTAIVFTAVCLCLGDSTTRADDSAAENQAARILRECEFQGGLIVHVGCGDGRLTAAFGAGHGRLVQGLARNARALELARRQVKAAGLYGHVSIDRLPDSRLPYADNMVNLLIAEDLTGIAEDEVMRVLCPGGKAYLRQGDP